MLAAEAAAAAQPARAKSVLFVFLFGGPSQLETFDMKPDAPSGIRGPFQPIASRTPGLRDLRAPAAAGRRCPTGSASSARVTHPHNDHNACHYIQTGHPMPPAPRGGRDVDATDKDWPAMGSVVEYLDQQAAAGRDFPSYVYLPNRLGHIQGYDRIGPVRRLARPAVQRRWPPRSASATPSDNPYFRACTDDELDFRIAGPDAPTRR